MEIKPLENFKSLETHHCVSGSLRHLYLYNEFDLSEDMLLGLGEGVSFIYWHQKGELPVLAGRGIPKPSLEEVVGGRTGVHIKSHTTTSVRKAEKTLVELLEAGQAIMLNVDMGFLPYLDFNGEEFHFGGHLVTACGFDRGSNTVLIADRDIDLHAMTMEQLALARASKFKPMPPGNRWFTADFSQKRMPTSSEVIEAIGNQSRLMLDPPISNIGVKGIRKAARTVPTWVDIFDTETLIAACFNAHIFINAEGGTGGGLFRYMFGRFLIEAASLVGNQEFADCGEAFREIGNRWEEVGKWFKQKSQSANPVDDFGAGAPMLDTIADLEEAAWSQLSTVMEVDHGGEQNPTQ